MAEREIGSFQPFSEKELPSIHNSSRWPAVLERAVLVNSCRSAIALILEASAKGATLHIPSYFCAEVVAYLSRFAPTRFYEDLPDGDRADFATVKPKPGDVVLAVNFFGTKDMDSWGKWKAENSGITLIADCTHSPLRIASSDFGADWYVASLRKSFPVPDGAYMLPRTANVLPGLGPIYAQDRGSLSAEDCLELMKLKRRYLDGDTSVRKEDFLPLLREWEVKFGRTKPAAASRISLDLLRRMDLCGIDAASHQARNYVFRKLRTRRFERFEFPRFNEEREVAPYVVGFCASSSDRDVLRREMAAREIYIPVHWDPVPGIGSAEWFSKRQFTLPVDYRCTNDDCDRIVEALGEVDELLCAN